ncbi:MAG: AtuA-related protein, partial [Chitinophagales bacterium]
VETALCTVPGICWTNAPGPAKPRIVHFPALLDKSHLQQKVHVVGKTIMVDEITYHGSPYVVTKHKLDNGEIDFSQEPMTLDYLGRLFATRSGDKGGNANLGIFGKTPESYAFLKQFLTVERLKTLLPDTVPFEIIRYDFPNLLGLNFYLIGFLGEGVAASIKVDVQAKTLGEYLRAKKVLLPKWLMTKD